jgi:hypothetical protein
MKQLLIIGLLFWHAAIFAQSLSNIESVEYDHNNHRFLVSNSSSIISLDPSSGDLSYFGSGSASYGMEVMNNTIFVISNGIKAYDLTSELEVMDLEIPGSIFLNGMASNGVDKLWLTDFSAKKVYEVDVSDLENPSYTIIIENTGSTPNGIVYDEDNNRLLFVNWNSNAPIKSIDLTTYILEEVISTSLGNCDGIDNDNSDNYYVSSWSPLQISMFNSDFSDDLVVIEAPGISSPADICYAQEIDTLAIPNSGNNTVTFIGFTTTGIDENRINESGLRIIGNPITVQSYIHFYNPSNSFIELSIYSVEGKLVKQLIKGNRQVGDYSILLNGIELTRGAYIAKLSVNNKVESIQFIK